MNDNYQKDFVRGNLPPYLFYLKKKSKLKFAVQKKRMWVFTTMQNANFDTKER